MKKLSSLLLVLLLTSLVGCGSSKAPSNESNAKQTTETTAKENKQDPVTLNYLWFADGIETQVMESIMEDYKKENPYVTFNLIEVAFNDLDTKLKTMIAGGESPALSRITNPGLLFNQTIDIGAVLGGYDAVTSQYMDALKPYYSKDGSVYGVPMDVTANGLIYNKTLFDKAGISVPQSPDDIWTWEEFESDIIAVKEKTNVKYGLLWDFSPHRWSTLMYEFGGSFIDAEGTKATVNSPESVAALQLFVDLHKKGVIPDSVWLGGENPNNLFRSGQAVAHLAGNWMISSYKDITDFEWGVTYLPIAKNRSSVPGGKYLMAFKNSGAEDEAVKFIKYFMQKDVTGKYCSESFFLSPRLDNSDLEYEYGSEMFNVFSNELANTPQNASLDWSKQDIIPAVYSDIKESILEALLDEKTPQEAFDGLADIIDQTIAEKK